jgi:hypothetical protein
VAKAMLSLIVAVGLLQVQPTAQATPAIDVGARIRVWTPEMGNVTGRARASTADTLVLQPDGGTTTVSIPLTTFVRIEINRGSQSRMNSAWRHAKWGALIGAVPGAISLGLQHEQVGGGSSAAKAALLGAWSGGLFGALIGGVVGAVNPGQDWERVR